ncbi:cyclic nucleotide-binding domain-containing protein [Rhodobacteraceae bacterium F11138]|nr:cyclic nucleotide-binding domain-containing protein [Rhodobacteraceae bacterium F11138]
MEPTLFSFIWKYSKRRQLILLLVTVITFPFLYASLELPKMIINDAIGATSNRVDLWGVQLSQVQYLLLLCLLFLGTVIVAGLMKMRVNTMKGVLSERMLRRLRYQLISRMMRFPRPYFRNTSQGELVSMITSEAEPMGGLMGDAVAQPAFQFGQMMTIVFFLFMQSVWFGLASIALIPLQAWLIPRLQRQINLLNKDRIVEIRHLSSEIGESAAGISDLRANGGWRYRLAMLTDRLGRLFDIRFQIYQKKFFMKFLNNTITQMTPFMFYLVGGYLAIRGDITVGALVAAIAAYKDLSSPWKELLTYYNQVQDMSLRWEIVTERFAPRDMIPEELFEGEPATMPHLQGDIEIDDVTVRDSDGNTVLGDVSLTIPAGSRVAIQCNSAVERSALAELLTREVLPVRGSVTLAGHRLNDLHQAVIAARVGYAHSRPYLFDGTLGDNLLMPLKVKPQSVLYDPQGKNRRATEARLSGNSTDMPEGEWVDPGLAGLKDGVDIRDWWFQLVGAMGIDEAMFRRTLRSRFDPKKHSTLAKEIVALRPEIHRRLQERGMDKCVYRFDPERFNPTIPLGGNLLFAAPVDEITQDMLVENGAVIRVLHELNLAEEGLSISQEVIDILARTFGRDGTDHPLFRRLGMDDDMYRRLSDIVQKRREKGDESLSERELSLLLTVPFLLTAEQIGSSFPDRFKDEILKARQSKAEDLRRLVGGQYIAISPDVYFPRMTVLENALYGRISMAAGSRAEDIENLVAEIMEEHDLEHRVAAIMYDLPTGLGGTNLPTVFQERTAFSRAAIKRPDILILDKALASHDSASRQKTREKLRELLPRATLIFMEDRFENPDAYDLFVEIKNGRLNGVARAEEPEPDGSGGDLQRKQKAIAQADLFAKMDARNQRLLAFGAQWFKAEPGQVVFGKGEPPDAAYLCLKGTAELRWPDKPADEPPLSIITPGRLIGDLSIITREVRQLDLVAIDEALFLRIGAEELYAVIESDVTVAMQLLEAVAGHLAGVAEILTRSNINYKDLSADNTVPEALDRIMDELDG